MVDRYLASPHYGEQRAHYWLDAVRYGDTNGIHFDNYREIWPYRDWVIAAFNRNQPFNQFTIDQIAGDLVPNATLDQRIATGFLRCSVTTNEAGIIEDEYTEIYAKDRADTFGSVFLGLTVGCAIVTTTNSIPSRRRITTRSAHSSATRRRKSWMATRPISRRSSSCRASRTAPGGTRSPRARPPLSQEMSHARAAAVAPFETWLRSRDPDPPQR